MRVVRVVRVVCLVGVVRVVRVWCSCGVRVDVWNGALGMKVKMKCFYNFDIYCCQWRIQTGRLPTSALLSSALLGSARL